MIYGVTARAILDRFICICFDFGHDFVNIQYDKVQQWQIVGNERMNANISATMALILDGSSENVAHVGNRSF